MASKFTFDVEFLPGGERLSLSERGRQKKVYSMDEIDQISARAREQGMKAGHVQALDAQTRELAKLIEILREVLTRSSKATMEVRHEASQLAFAIARKLSAAAVRTLPTADVEETLRHALHQAVGEPRVVLHTSTKVAELLGPKLAEIAHEEGFEGRLAISGDASFAAADCRLEWRGGGSERSESTIEAAIADLIARRFSNSSSVED
jgi:flagellar assembly protein FliH